MQFFKYHASFPNLKFRMNDNPALLIDLKKIEQNARTITTLCRQHGISVAAVTKVTCAIPEVAEAMLRAGCTMLADSRIENLQRLRTKQFDVEYLLLRLPMISEAEDVVRSADISLNSEVATIKALNSAAQRLRTTHKIILMIDLGDLREGIWPDTLREHVDEIVRCDHIIFEGIGCNLACYTGVIPSPENMNFLLQQKNIIEAEYNIALKIISGGNSSGLELLASGKMPAGINHFRVGETILLGRNVIDRSAFPGTHQDTFVLRGEIIEHKRKPSAPIGEIGQDAFGNTPEFENKGLRLRAILGVGRQDANIEGLEPLDKQIEILGASSDHLLVDITDSHQNYQVGDTIDFLPNYASVLAASTSKYVKKIFVKTF